MAELRDALQPLGLQNIRTYIQSGNILFESSESEERLQQQIQETILTTFTITSTVIIRTADEFHSIVNNCPFPEQDLTDASATATGESLHVALLPVAPTEINSAKLLQYVSEKSAALSRAEMSICYFTIAFAMPNLVNTCISWRCPLQFAIGKR